MSPDHRRRLLDTAVRCTSALGPWFYWLGLRTAGRKRRDPRC
ncbi:MAG TPA: hypothetical protein VD836_02200 [Solirubrobacteraceae bacterium]|nr:hypothetical protein [Solirubrobacteraceae bacterium]